MFWVKGKPKPDIRYYRISLMAGAYYDMEIEDIKWSLENYLYKDTSYFAIRRPNYNKITDNDSDYYVYIELIIHEDDILREFDKIRPILQDMRIELLRMSVNRLDSDETSPEFLEEIHLQDYTPEHLIKDYKWVKRKKEDK